MLELIWWWALLLLPLPLLVYRFGAPLPQQQGAALRVPSLTPFTEEQHQATQGAGERIPRLVAALLWLVLLLAAARPQWVGEAIEIPVSGRDLMLAVDLSGSMEVEDFQRQGRMINRLTATQWLGGAFIERRVGDRIGLILFGSNAYLQAPLTFDRQTVRRLLAEAALGLAGDNTAIGDAIGLAVKRIDATRQQGESINPVLILLTDGANTAGEVKPLDAARLAAEHGVKIYTIGIGADEMLVRSLFGTRRVNPSADLDEKGLTAIAEQTGGRYFRARDSEEFEAIYQLLDELEPVARESISYRPITDLYYWPLALALLLGLGLSVWLGWRRGNV